MKENQFLFVQTYTIDEDIRAISIALKNISLYEPNSDSGWMTYYEGEWNCTFSCDALGKDESSKMYSFMRSIKIGESDYTLESIELNDLGMSINLSLDRAKYKSGNKYRLEQIATKDVVKIMSSGEKIDTWPGNVRDYQQGIYTSVVIEIPFVQTQNVQSIDSITIAGETIEFK